MAEITVSIGGLPIQFEIGSQQILSRIIRRYQGFLQKDVKAIFNMQCRFSSRFSSKDETVTIKHSGEKSWQISRSDFECSIENKSGKITMRRSIYSFDACLRVLYATLFSMNKGLLLHAAGIVKNTNAYLFAGPSGSGKSTSARLSSSIGTVINDEIVACDVSNRGLVAIYGTPFWGEMEDGPAFNTFSPLHAIYFLKKDVKCFKTVLSLEEALTRLLRCCCVFGNEPQDMEKIMETAITIVNAVPVYELHFEKNSLFWDVV